MLKRALTLMMALVLCLAVAQISMAAASVSATYRAGTVTVSGSGFSGGSDYIVRIVNRSTASITAMDQVKSDAGGTLTAGITTGSLATLSDYTVYVNKLDGSLVAEDGTITAATAAPPAGGGSGSTGSSAVTTSGGTVTSTITSTPTNGKITASADSKTVQSMIDEAGKVEAAGGNAVIQISVTSPSGAAVSAVSVGLGKSELTKIAQQTNADVTINTSVGKVTFDAKAVDTIAGSATADVTISISKVDKATLSETVVNEVGDRPVYSFSVSSGSTGISDFGGGAVTVSLPYTLRDGEDPNAILVYYIDASGSLQAMRSIYDSATGTVQFVTSHFSSYMIGYNKVAFSDVPAGEWFAAPVTFIAARGITNGIDGSDFGPGLPITRGSFAVMILRAYGIAPDAASADNFSDAGNTFYTGYLAAAKRLGITTGIGNNQYAPEKQITRQDAFTLLYRTLTVIGEAPEGTGLGTIQSFGDYGEVSDYAKTALNALLGAGIVKGASGQLKPGSNCTRAEMAQVIYNLLNHV